MFPAIYESARVKIVGCIVVNLPAIIFNNCLENKLSCLTRSIMQGIKLFDTMVHFFQLINNVFTFA